MPKASKSSASSATRKKHARKAAGPSSADVSSPPKSKSKPSKKEIKKGLVPPPKKSYIAPSKLKPAPVEVDPLDSLGLAGVLPPDIVVVLRRLAKKDAVTKTRALEELGSWISIPGEEDSEIGASSRRTDVSLDVLLSVIPIWLHRFPALSIHPSRRIRLLSASLHASLLQILPLRSAIFTFLQETGSENQVSHVLGAWCLSAWDVDRGVAAVGNKSWRDAISLEPAQSESPRDSGDRGLILDEQQFTQTLLPFILTTAMDPDATYSSLNPSHLTTPGASPRPSHIGLPATPPRVATPPVPARRSVLSADSLSMTPPREGDQESAEDQKARLRVGAMSALRWIFDTYPPTPSLITALRYLVLSPSFWSVLHYAANPPFMETQRQSQDLDDGDEMPPGLRKGFGFGQTIVRRAGWNLLNALMGSSGMEASHLKWKENVSEASSSGLLPTAILRSAFVEPDPAVRSSMWGPLLVSLTKLDNIWISNLGFENSSRKGASQDYSASRSSGEDEDTEPEAPRRDSTINVAPAAFDSTAYTEFLAFLSLGCNGSPIHGYPTILVILSTIPPEILPLTLPGLSEFFSMLWSAIDGQALSTLAAERVKGTDAFLTSWGECLIWTSRKLIKSASVPSDLVPTVSDLEASQNNVTQGSPNSVAHALVKSQFESLVEQLGKGFRVDASVIGEKVTPVLGKLEQISPDLFEQAWMQISSFAMAAMANPEDLRKGDSALAFLAALYRSFPSESPARQEVEQLVIKIAMDTVKNCLELCRSPAQLVGRDLRIPMPFATSTKVLEKLMKIFDEVLNGDEEFVNCIDELIHANIESMLSQITLVLSYLMHRFDTAQTTTAWCLLLSTLGHSPQVDIDTKLHVFDVILNSIQLDSPVNWARPQGGELDDLANYALTKALDGDSAMLNLTEIFLKRSDAFLDPIVTDNMISRILMITGNHARSLLRDPSAPLKTLRSTFNLLLALEKESVTRFYASIAALDSMPRIFLLAFVLPQCALTAEESHVLDLSKQVWDTWSEGVSEDTLESASRKIKHAIKGLLLDTNVRPRPTPLLQALHDVNDLHAKHIVYSEILPTQSELDDLLASSPEDPIDTTLAVIQPLSPPMSSTRTSELSSWNRSFDDSGFSAFARSVTLLLHIMATDRQFARENIWALRYTLILALYANEVLQVPEADSPVFRLHAKSGEAELREILRKTQQIAAFLLIPPGADTWHKTVVTALTGTSSPSTRLDSMGAFVKLVFEASMKHGTVRDSLVLHTVLQHILRSATKDDADLWIELARGLEEKALQTSLAISLAVTEVAPEPPKLDRYRNELASKIAGLLPSKANTTGFRLLRHLSAVAPDPESDVIFLPQQRAVYLVQALQRWVASDEDLTESVESEITSMLFHLTPILQNVQGIHWEFIMDMIESNIQSSSMKDADTLVLLSRSLRLLLSVRDLSESNKYLRQLWDERSKVVLVLIRDLLAIRTDKALSSVPRTVCRRQALNIIQDLPGALMDENTLSTMFHLLTDSSVDVQKMVHQLLQKAAITRTEHLVIEAGVDPDAAIELPPELLAFLQNRIDTEADITENNGSTSQDPLAYLFGWMILLDLFADASLRVTTAYIDQMRRLDVIGEYLLPNIFELLGLGDGQKPFRLGPWGIDEYWIAFYDPDAPQSLKLLAAYLYYRALHIVPALIRSWWEELKDRQLLATVTSYTSSHFSPLLIASELMDIKPAQRMSALGEESLTDESFNVKVALSVHEVTATFNVDDQQMEIGVRLPAEYPLRAVEVRDIRRVGVPEKLWRKWLFAMQQVVTSQNGRIVDALSLFKKNVSLHFEGQVECAICYSIISVVDRSLPAKPCKTCKNRFHSSCLYKWFNTSHSSSCPLCRSDIM